MYKYRLQYYVFEDKKTRLDLILILLLCLDSLQMKKTHMNNSVYRNIRIGISFRLSLTKFR